MSDITVLDSVAPYPYPEAWPDVKLTFNIGGQFELFTDVQLDAIYQSGDPVLPLPADALQGLPSSGITDPLVQNNLSAYPTPKISFLIFIDGNEYLHRVSLPDSDPLIPGWHPPDSYNYYVDEPNEIKYGTIPINGYGYIPITKSYALHFLDAPELGSPRPISGWYTQFFTRLVGVSTGFVEVPLVGSNIKFTWRSNAISISQVDFLKVLDPGVLPPLESGGVYDVLFADPSGNTPPQLSAIPDQQVNEGSMLNLTAAATDLDPSKTLSYSLDAGAPSGAKIDPKTGLLSWNVPDSEPPGDYSVTIRVTDNGTPPLSDAETFTVVVNQVALLPRVVSISTVHVKKKGTKEIDVFFNEPMSPGKAGYTSSYIVFSPIPGGTKRRHKATYKPISFSARYLTANNSVALTLRQPTKKHLVLTVRKFLVASNGLDLGADFTVNVQ
jgi:hypothetical protein